MNSKMLLAVSALSTVLSAAFADGRTVSVSSVEDDSHGRHARANLSLSSGDVAVLHLAYGTTAGGDDVDSWEHCRPVAMILGATTSYSYEFPRDIGDDICAVRFFLLEDYDIPLAKRYDYVETDGTQFVRTSFFPTGLSAVEMELSLNSTSTSVALCGSRAYGTDTFVAFYMASDVGWRFDYFVANGNSGHTAAPDTFYRLKFDGTGMWLDGLRIKQPYSMTSGTVGIPLALFGMNDKGTVKSMPSAKFRSVKIWSDLEDETSLAFDLIPTEKDGETCLYNRVDGTYLKSAVEGHPLAHGAEVAVGRPSVLSRSATLTGSFGEERSIRVAAKHRDRRLTSVDLAFTAGLDRKLYVAYGKNDGGDDVADWQNVRYVDVIPGSATEYSFTIPESWGADVDKMRFFLMAKEYIHGCDAVCEGIAVTNKRVDTAFWPYTDTTIDMTIAFATVSESQALFTARASNGASTMTLFYLSGGWRFDYLNTQHPTNITAETGRKYAINVSAYGLKVDDSTVIKLSKVSMDKAGSALALLSLPKPSNNSPFKGTLYSFKAKNGKTATDDVAVDLDLVPCQKDGQACLYNRVNGEFLPFTGSGTATPVGATANGTPISETDTLPMYSGFVLSYR